MQIEYKFRNLESSEAIKAYAQDKLGKLDKYMNTPIEVHVTLSLERRLHCVDITLHAGGEHYKGSAEQEDMYASIDAVVDKILRQLHRARGQNHNHRRGPAADDSAGE